MMTKQEICYAIAKQVPEIARVAVFETKYGTLRLDPDESFKIAEMLERLLRKRLRAAAESETTAGADISFYRGPGSGEGQC